MTYKQLTLQKRYQIWALLQQGYRQKEIARKIDVHPSTISRELKRNWDVHSDQYEYTTAHFNTIHRHKNKPKYTAITAEIERYIRENSKQVSTAELN